jgi:hypothetical protein
MMYPPCGPGIPEYGFPYHLRAESRLVALVDTFTVMPKKTVIFMSL